MATLVDELTTMEERLRTLTRLMTTKAAIAQTPKELVWTLNKAKLYRYILTVPAKDRYPVPLLLIFALMNRPSILDLRPGNSFVEFMVSRGYDVYLLDWGVPGIEDKDLKFDDYTLDYMPVTDIIPMTGGAYRQLIVDLYRNDRLMKNELIIRGERVDISKLRANLLTVIAEGDHITPPCQSEALISKVGSKDTEVFRVKGGHIGIMAGSGAHRTTWPHIDGWLGPRSR
jgi:poly(3-hydroxyalkanoate) synthetase